MYLVRLYKFSKVLFAFIVGCICLQLFINLKRGMTVTPFLHYGMYAEKFNLPNSVRVWELVVDGQKLNLSDWYSVNADYILEPIRSYSSNQQSTVIYQQNISRLLTKFHVPFHPSDFDTYVSQPTFNAWYKKRLSTILKRNVSTIDVFESSYSVEGAILKKIESKIIYAIN